MNKNFVAFVYHHLIVLLLMNVHSTDVNKLGRNYQQEHISNIFYDQLVSSAAIGQTLVEFIRRILFMVNLQN